MSPGILFESVPNFSEGRRPEIVRRIADAAGSTAGVWTLDLSSDADHNRSVLSLAGPPRRLREALLRLFAAAIEAIDLRRHEGRHPRMGAVDVVPFIPLEGARLQDCVREARALAEEAARRFDLPVFLYEAAASAPARRNLADVRRGGFEALEERLRDPAWRPDFGPPRPHPSAGAVAIGARKALVAYNVNLRSDDAAVAKDIARRVRESSGGLPAVKALGLALEQRGLVQVSMNLVDFELTPPLAVFERIGELAAERGVEIAESEIVGLVPRAALPPDPAARLRLARFEPSQILENRIAEARRLASAGPG